MHRNKFKPNSQRKNLKYVPTPLPNRPSISFMEPYHNSILFRVLTIPCFVRFAFIVSLYFILLCKLIDLAFELSVTVFVNFDLIWRLIVNDCGKAFNVSLQINVLMKIFGNSVSDGQILHSQLFRICCVFHQMFMFLYFLSKLIDFYVVITMNVNSECWKKKKNNQFTHFPTLVTNNELVKCVKKKTTKEKSLLKVM